MPGPSPGAQGMRPRAGGGFNQVSDELGSEHMQNSAMQQLMQNKTASQSVSDPGAGQTSQSKAMQQAMAQQQQRQQGQAGAPQAPPPEIGSIPDEFKRAGNTVVQELNQFFSLNTWLGIEPYSPDPEEMSKRKKVHDGYQKLDKEQQAVAREMYQKEVKRKQAIEEEEQRKKQAEIQKKQNSSVEMPSSPQKGPVGPGAGKSKKQSAMQQLQQSRQQLSTPGGAN